MGTSWRTAALAFAAFLWAGGVAFAAGDTGNDGSAAVKRNLTRASGLIEAGSYNDAIHLLKKVTREDSRSADAFNFLGYSHRKLGNVDQALRYYRIALTIEPRHRGANEYLGELYLELGQLDKAEERLAVLDGECFFGCEEYTDLKSAIDDFKARQGN